MKIKNIIWDWNGTLVDDVPLTVEVVNRMLSARNKENITIERYREIYEHPIQNVYERSGFDLELEPFEKLTHEWHSTYLSEIDCIPLHVDTRIILDTFKTKGFNQTILTALPHDILCHSLERHLITDYFSYYQGLDNRLAKSKIDNGHKLMDKLNFKASETIMIGDSKHDLESANALGVSCLLVSRGFESKERLLEYGCEVFEDFNGLTSRIINL